VEGVDDALPRPAPGVIAIGASAGGIEALQRLMRELPEELPAAVCLVLHIPASSRSLLAEIINRQTPLPVRAAADGEPLRAGHVYVAPPDCHLRVNAGRLRLDRGPKENGVRPAIDPLFRSVAEQYGARGIAVVLSGSLSDGAGGAAAVAAAGGAVLVQDPGDAVVPSMPEAALGAVPGAVALDALGLADELARRAAALPHADAVEVVVNTEEPRPSGRPDGPPSGLTCPECHGPLWRLQDGELVRYRCRVGHLFGEDVLVEGKAAAVETALWMAVEALEERNELLGKMADRLAGSGRASAADRVRERARSAGERAELIRGVLAIDDDAGEAVAAETT
jgi:two-component system, chemotaxis family, protein-glutamate methylesterase/glutaminase